MIVEFDKNKIESECQRISNKLNNGKEKSEKKYKKIVEHIAVVEQMMPELKVHFSGMHNSYKREKAINFLYNNSNNLSRDILEGKEIGMVLTRNGFLSTSQYETFNLLLQIIIATTIYVPLFIIDFFKLNVFISAIMIYATCILLLEPIKEVNFYRIRP